MEIRISPEIVLLLKWASTLVLFTILIAYVSSLVRSLLALRWLTVEGELTDLDLLMSDGDGDSSPTYTPIAKYRYTVNGATYISDNVGFGVWGLSILWLSERTLRKACAQPLLVFYNPINPGQSVLVRGFTLHHFVCLLLVTTTFVIAVYALRDGF